MFHAAVSHEKCLDLLLHAKVDMNEPFAESGHLNRTKLMTKDEFYLQ